LFAWVLKLGVLGVPAVEGVVAEVGVLAEEGVLALPGVETALVGVLGELVDLRLLKFKGAGLGLVATTGPRTSSSEVSKERRSSSLSNSLAASSFSATLLTGRARTLAEMMETIARLEVTRMMIL
jgi:hypothetical protein